MGDQLEFDSECDECCLLLDEHLGAVHQLVGEFFDEHLGAVHHVEFYFADSVSIAAGAGHDIYSDPGFAASAVLYAGGGCVADISILIELER